MGIGVTMKGECVMGIGMGRNKGVRMGTKLWEWE